MREHIKSTRAAGFSLGAALGIAAGALVPALLSAPVLLLAPTDAHAQVAPGSTLYDVDTRPAPKPKQPAAPAARQRQPGPRSTEPGAASDAPARPSAEGEARAPAPTRNARSTRNAEPSHAVAGTSGKRLRALDGRWQDTACVPVESGGAVPGVYLKRQYEFDDAKRTWKVNGNAYSGRDCSDRERLLSFRGNGQYEISGSSRAVANASEVAFTADQWSATPVNRNGVMMLFNGRCGSGDFDEGVAIDMSRTGCRTLALRPARSGVKDLDIVRMDENRLQLGVRSADLPVDERPGSLATPGMRSVR